MKYEVQLETKKVLTVDDLTNSSHIGYICMGEKGYVCQIGGPYFVAVTISEELCNSVWSKDRISSCMIKSVIENLIKYFDVGQIYKFDTRKELYQWLSED